MYRNGILVKPTQGLGYTSGNHVFLPPAVYTKIIKFIAAAADCFAAAQTACVKTVAQHLNRSATTISVLLPRTSIKTVPSQLYLTNVLRTLLCRPYRSHGVWMSQITSSHAVCYVTRFLI